MQFYNNLALQNYLWQSLTFLTLKMIFRIIQSDPTKPTVDQYHPQEAAYMSSKSKKKILKKSNKIWPFYDLSNLDEISGWISIRKAPLPSGWRS